MNLTIEGVGKRYKGDFWGLRDFTLELGPGGAGAWLVGALFIPTFALALGVWSGTSKLFEILYLVIWYIGPMNHVPVMDYLGSTPAGLAQGMPLMYLAATALLAAAAVAGRRRQLQAG